MTMTDDLTTNPSVPELLGFLPLGEVFLSARSGKNLSLKDVSNNLRLSVRQIEALENNDFSALPQPMITRGFIRNYARLLELDAEPLLESYRARMPEILPGALSVQSSMHQVTLGKNSQPWLKYILGSILILLFLVAWFFYIEYMPKPVKQPADNPVVVTPNNVERAVIPLPEVALPAAERQPESTDVISTEATIANTETVIDKNTNVAQVIPDEKQAIVKENMTAIAPVVTSTKNVQLSVSEQTWVRVSDKNGAVIYEKMLAANSTDGFDGQPPFNLWIGNAKATTLTFLGKPVDITSQTKSNIARVTLE